METEKKDRAKNHRGTDIGPEQMGTVKIANDVVAMIAALAALEVDGVPALAGDVKSEAVDRITRARLSKCVKVLVSLSQVRIDIAVMMDYGYNIPTTSSKVQTRVKSAIENMTGLKVVGVNVRIAGVCMNTAG